jgi:hypothetical protein
MTCPPDELWLRLLDEAVETDELPGLRRHLEGCAACRSRLDDLSDPPSLRRLGAVGIAPPAPVPSRLLERIDRIGALGPRGVGIGPGADLETGAVLESYRIEATLGRGGAGVVYRAWDTRLGREVAVKCLRAERAEERDRPDVEREARSAALLRHDHIVPVYAVGDLPDGGVFLVMPLIEGPTLRRRIQEGGPLAPREAAETVRQVADALAFTHTAGVVHRDVKPGNILLDRRDGRAKLADFGLARLAREEALTTREGVTLCGTPEYLCPELIRHGRTERETDGDIYALGVTLYECLTGVVPFRGQPHRVLHQILNEDPRPPRDWIESIPIELESICLKAMATEPAERYPSAAAVRDELARWLRGEPVEARPPTLGRRGLKWTRRHPWQTATMVAAGGVIVASVTAAWLLYGANAEARRANDALRLSRGLSDEAFHLSRSALHEIVDGMTDRLFAVPNTVPLLLEAYEKSVALHEKLVALRPEDRDSVLGYGHSLSQLCTLQMLHGQIPEAEATYARYLRFAEPLPDRFPNDAQVALMLVDALRCRETLSNKQGRSAEAQAAVQRYGAIVERLAAARRDVPEVLQARVVSLMSRITDLRRAQRYEEAVAAGCEAVELLESWRAVASDPVEPLQTLDFLLVLQARSLEALGRIDEAAAAAARAGQVQSAPELAGVSQRDRDWSRVQLRKIEARIAGAREAGGAGSAYRALRELLRAQIAAYPEEDGFREDLILALLDEGDLLAARDPEQARALAEEARGLAESLARDVPEVERYRRLQERAAALLDRLSS